MCFFNSKKEAGKRKGKRSGSLETCKSFFIKN